MRSPWVQQFAPSRAAIAGRIFCFHHAGGAASAYRAWSAELPAHIDLCAVQLPGRATRLREPPLRDIPAIVTGVTDALEGALDLPFAFFGHSMGAVVACEVARELVRRRGPVPAHLFVSSRRPPHIADPTPALRGLSDAEFVVEIDRRYGGIPPEVAAHADVMAMLLPGLRADIEALERHSANADERVPCPITAFGGVHDRLAPPEQLEAWRDLTHSSFRLKLFGGGHFYVDTCRAEVVAAICATWDPARSDAVAVSG